MSERFDPTDDSAEIAAATNRLLDTARALSDADVAGPSLLPGWTRGHVLTHIARNADGLVNLLSGARDGVQRTAYPAGPEGRAADIEAGAGRPIDELVADVAASHERFAAAVGEVPDDRWDFEQAWGSAGERRPARAVLAARLREVAIHHVDLNTDYTAADWAPGFALHILRLSLPALEARGIAPLRLHPTDLDGEVVIAVSGGSDLQVSGPAHALATWLLGRDRGDRLVVAGGELPEPPAWG
jgi:maleylpyruvate isomerase